MLVLRFCLMVAIALTIAPQVTFIDPRLSAFEAFAPQFGIGSLALAAILAFRHRKLALAGVVAAAWNAFLVLPTVIPPSQASVQDGSTLKVLNLNLWYENQRFAETLYYLKNSGADVIGLNEVTPASKVLLEALRPNYPYSVDCVETQVLCDVMLLSRLPIQNGFAGSAGAKFAYVARGDIDWQGRAVSVVTTHPTLPFVQQDRAAMLALLPPDDPSPQLPGAPLVWQSMQVAAVAQYSASLAPERIVMGDFNSVAWGKAQTAFRAATGLDNRGHFAPTWTLQLPFVFRTQIDHVFTGGDLVVTRFQAGPDVGSDHLPVEAEIALRGKD